MRLAEHCEKFARVNKKPKWPARSAVIREIEAHNFHKIGVSTIADAFFNENPVLVQEVIATTLMIEYLEADRQHEARQIEFEKFVINSNEIPGQNSGPC